MSGGPSDGPPDALVRALLDGPSALSGFEWHDEVGSTNALAADAARRGVPEIHAVAADVQTAGRGRRGRSWHALPGSSLMVSLVLRPQVSEATFGTLPLLIGSVLAEVVSAHLWDGQRGPDVGLKWPNDLLVEGRKVAGILIERFGSAAVAGIGCNVDWRGVERPADLAEAGSLAEFAGAGRDVDRWRLFAGLIGVLDHRYADWQADPGPTLASYRTRCDTLGRWVRVERGGPHSTERGGRSVEPGGQEATERGDRSSERGDRSFERGGQEAIERDDHQPLEGRATAITDEGNLRLATPDGDVTVAAGDVVHLRPR